MNGMVTFVNVGRLGNFMFQTATTMAYAWRNGIDFTVPNKTKDPKSNPVYFPHLVNLAWDPSRPCVTIQEYQHNYQELPYKPEWAGSNIVLDGYWQTERYFKEFRNDVIREFGLKWEPWPGIVSVHVRRGDYLRLRHKHPVVTDEWIEKAMAQFQGFKFRFFSDDIPYCKATFGHRGDVSFSDGADPLQDLSDMSCCEHHVGSASTFNWWGAWLNQNPDKRIILPKFWFVPGHSNLNTSEIVPESWERM